MIECHQASSQLYVYTIIIFSVHLDINRDLSFPKNDVNDTQDQASN